MPLIFANKVTNKDWLSLKPYQIFTDYDKPFLKIANEVYQLFLSEKKWFYKYEMKSEQLKELACILTSYFEDFISEIGIWQAFINHNKETCGYYIPFYDLTDYDSDYLNWQDIAYLIWHYMSKNNEHVTLAADYPLTKAYAREIFTIYEDAIETTDATDFYATYFSIPDKLNFFDFKTKLAWLAFDSYLLGPDAKRDFAEETATSKAARPLPGQQEIFKKLLYSYREKYLYSFRYSFGALNAPELFSKLADYPESKRAEIKNLSFAHSGKFKFEGTEANGMLFRHLVTHQLYKVREDSVQKIPAKEREKSIFDFSVVKWDNEWWITGIMKINVLSPTEIAHYQRQPFNTPWMYTPEHLQKLQKSVDLMYESFVEFYGLPLATFDSAQKLEASLEAYFDYHEKKQGRADEASKKKRAAFKKNQPMPSPITILPGQEEFTGIFFVKGGGTITLSGLKETIQQMKAKKIRKEEKEDLFLNLTIHYQPAISAYLLENYPTKNVKFPIPGSQVNALDNMAYFWRYYNPEEFDPVYPYLTMIDFE